MQSCGDAVGMPLCRIGLTTFSGAASSGLEALLRHVRCHHGVSSVCSEEIEKMSIKELRAFLGGRGVSTIGFLEKSEFLSAAKQAAQQ